MNANVLTSRVFSYRVQSALFDLSQWPGKDDAGPTVSARMKVEKTCQACAIMHVDCS